MESTRIQNSETEQIRVTALDIEAAYVTGLTDVLLEIRRESDGYYLDFDDSTFKNSSWTTRQEQMAELDVTNSPGVYFYDFDTTGLSDDNYFIRVSSATAYNTPWEGELKVGGYVDDLDATISSRASEVNATTNTNNIVSEVDDNEAKIDLLQVDLTQVLADVAGLNDLSIANIQTALTNQGYTVVRAPKLDNLDTIISSRASEANATTNTVSIITEIDENEVNIDEIILDIEALVPMNEKLDRILGLSLENQRIVDPVYNRAGELQSGTIKIYPSAADTEADTNVLAEYQVTATYGTGKNIKNITGSIVKRTV